MQLYWSARKSIALSDDSEPILSGPDKVESVRQRPFFIIHSAWIIFLLLTLKKQLGKKKSYDECMSIIHHWTSK